MKKLWIGFIVIGFCSAGAIAQNESGNAGASPEKMEQGSNMKDGKSDREPAKAHHKSKKKKKHKKATT